MADRLVLPGFVNAHSHTFQRALRGRAAGGDFWAWREVMLAEAERQTPELVRTSYEAAYREMFAAGYTAVGEFHYLGVAEAKAAAEAAAFAGVQLTLLHVAYARGGIARFRQESVAAYLADVETLRAGGLGSGSPPTPCAPVPLTGSRQSPRTPAPSPFRSTFMPTSSRGRSRSASPSTAAALSALARTGCLGERTTVVHATHADGAELDLLGSSGATVCACPTTEADLGDGFLPRRADPDTRDPCSASARTRTSASTRSRSCASSRASRGARPGGAASSRRRSCTGSAASRARVRSGS